jgi:hypothetical protein
MSQLSLLSHLPYHGEAMNDEIPIPPRMVPPGSAPLRELAHAIDRALTLSREEAELGELGYLRAARGRARLVRQVARKILSDRELDDDDLMVIVAHLRAEAEDLSS